MLAFSHRLLGFPACSAIHFVQLSLGTAIGVGGGDMRELALSAGRGLLTGEQVEGKGKTRYLSSWNSKD